MKNEVLHEHLRPKGAAVLPLGCSPGLHSVPRLALFPRLPRQRLTLACTAKSFLKAMTTVKLSYTDNVRSSNVKHPSEQVAQGCRPGS